MREGLHAARGDRRGGQQAGQWVELPPGVYKLTLGPLVLGNDVVFGVGFGGNQSAGARTTMIDARGASTVLTVAGGASAVVAGLTLTGGWHRAPAEPRRSRPMRSCPSTT